MTREEYINSIFDVYQLVSVLSERNESKTLRLRHKTMEKDIVLRSFPKSVEAYEELCSFRCENLPEVYESAVLEDGHVVLEEFIDGMTVAQIMETTKYNYRSAKRVVLGLCNALTVLHDRRIVHRDVKPENILIGSDGRIVLIDLNISRRRNTQKRDTVIMGTVGYASPEQLGIAQSDSRTDIYAAGVLLNVMLTGKHPSEEISKGYARHIIRKCINVDPNVRYQSAKKLADALI